MTWVNFWRGLSVGLLALAAGAASAAGTTSTFNVKLKINKNCTIDTVSDLVFADQTFLTANVDATTSVNVNCTKNTSATVSLSGTAGSRTMSNGSDTISYELYQDSGHSTPWDSSSTVTITGAGVDSSGASLDTSTTTATIYGRVPPQDTNTTGDYADSVTATVTF